MIPFWRSIAVLALSLVISSSAVAQDPDYHLSIDSVEDDAGVPLPSKVHLTSTGADIAAWSYGVCIDPTYASITDVSSGSTTQSVRSGSPPEYEQLTTFSNGFTQAVLICFAGCSPLSPGAGYELANVVFVLNGPDGLDTDACFCESLGSPPVETILVDTNGTAIDPVTECGTLSIPSSLLPITGYTCTPQSDGCGTDLLLTWSNGPGWYSHIYLSIDGTVVDTLPGSTTSWLLDDIQGEHDYCLEGETSGVYTPLVCCTIAAPATGIPPLPIENLSCSVDHANCHATLMWDNAVDYSSIAIAMDGSPVATLGDATVAEVDLPGTGFYELCVEATTICGDATGSVCCTVECASPFIRGDANADTEVNLADVVYVLNHLLIAGPLSCRDAGDFNDDGAVDIADPVFGLEFLFQFGPTPPPPSNCAIDPTPDGVSCESFSGC